MKARVKATGEIVEVEKNGFGSIYSASDGNHYFDTDLDFNLDPPHPEATISGWVCRDEHWDENYNTNLWIGTYKPIRRDAWWGASNSALIPISPSFFPSITWRDDPIEVEITIKPKKQ